MGKKQLFLYSVFLSIISSATAQAGITQGSGQTGIIPLMASLLGIPITNIDGFFVTGLLGAIIVLTLSTYIVLETAIRGIARRTGASEYGTSGAGNDLLKALDLDNGGRSRRLLVLSFAIVLTSMGASNIFLNIVWNLQALILTAFALGILGGLLYVVGGSLVFAGHGTRVTASGIEEIDKGAKDISNVLNGIKGEEEEVEREIDDLKGKEDQTEKELSSEDANPHQVEGEIEEELKEFEDIESKIETIENNMQTILSDIKNKEDTIFRQQKKEEKGLEEIQDLEVQMMHDLKSFLQNLEQRLSQGDNPQRLLEDLKRQNQQLGEIEQLMKMEAEVHRQVDHLVGQLRALKNVLGRLDKEIQQLESEEQELEDEEKKAEQLDQSYGDSEDANRLKKAENETSKAKKELSKIIQKRDDLEAEIQYEIDELKQEKGLEKKEIREVKQILSELRQEEELLDAIRRKFDNISEGGLSGELKQLYDAVTQMGENIERIENEARKLLGEE